MPALIELDRATVLRGPAVALDNVSLRLPQGQHTVVLGPNGCGKSTFIKLIHRELYPLAREGEAPVKVMGQSRWVVSELRHQLGIVSNDMASHLLDMHELSAREAVLSGLFASWVVVDPDQVTPERIAAADAALERCQARHLAERPLATLSTGEARRVLIARALVQQPRALLLDEPTTGLDIAAQQHVLQLLGLLADDGVTLVLVTHHLEEIIPAIDRVILLDGGRVVADGAPAQVLHDGPLSAAYGMPLRVHHDGDRYYALPRRAGLT